MKPLEPDFGKIFMGPFEESRGHLTHIHEVIQQQ